MKSPNPKKKKKKKKRKPFTEKMLTIQLHWKLVRPRWEGTKHWRAHWFGKNPERVTQKLKGPGPIRVSVKPAPIRPSMVFGLGWQPLMGLAGFVEWERKAKHIRRPWVEDREENRVWRKGCVHGLKMDCKTDWKWIPFSEKTKMDCKEELSQTVFSPFWKQKRLQKDAKRPTKRTLRQCFEFVNYLKNWILT